MKYLEKKVVVVLVIKTLDGLKDKISTLISKGYDVLEVTLRTECAFDAIKLVKEEFPELKVGAGTILTMKQFYYQCSNNIVAWAIFIWILIEKI